MKQRKIRKKPTLAEAADEDEEPTSMVALFSQRSKPKSSKGPKPSRTGLLSFDEDPAEAASPGLKKPSAGQLRPSSMKVTAPPVEKRSTYTQVSNTGMHALYQQVENCR